MAAKIKTNKKETNYFPKNVDQKKRMSSTTRKRKAQDENRLAPKWDIDADSTAKMYQELGLGQLSEDSNSMDMFSHPTPSIHIPDISIPPGAPGPLSQSSSGYASGVLSSSGYASGILSSQENFSPSRSPTSMSVAFVLKKPRTHSERTDDAWSHLSDEIILGIFNWLPKYVLVRCGMVCKRWNRLAFDETLWKRLDLASKVIKSNVLGCILDRGVTVLRLAKADIKGPVYSDSMSLTRHLLCSFSKVQYLDLSMTTINPSCLHELLQYCRQIKNLSLENLALSDDICSEIGSNSQLRVLNMSMCQEVTEHGLLYIVDGCTRLEVLNIAWAGLSRGAVQLLVLSLPNGLLRLNLSGCREQVTDDDVLHLVRTCPYIKELDLSDSSLTGVAVQHISDNLKGLEYVALSRCYSIQPAVIPTLADCSLLLAVDVFGMMKEQSLENLRDTMKHIEVNKYPFSSIARPTTGIRRTSIWGLRVRENFV